MTSAGSLPTPVTVERAAAILGTGSHALAAREFPWPDVDLNWPGLYAWWVDEVGANDLSQGLGRSVAPGLVYAGQAGATSTLAAVESGATLRSRIRTNHLGHSHSASTWRKSLAAILRAAHSWDFARESRAAEASLTEWMRTRLSLAVVPVSSGTDLHPLEHAVLELLDPPLNLQHMAPTATRLELKRLRRVLNEECRAVRA